MRDVRALLLALAAACAGPPQAADERSAGWTAHEWRDWTLTVGPQTDLYPRYVADPRRPRISLTQIETLDSEIEEAGDARYGVVVGGRFGALRLHPAGEPERGFQIDGEAGIRGEFDQDQSTDNIGWDGLFGFQIAWRATDEVALLVGTAHDSAHIGDELIEKTGRERIEYTREELRLGASWTLTDIWRVYGEYGHGYNLRNEELMEPGRAQCGIEYEPPPRWWHGHMGGYAAADLSMFEEDDWSGNLTVQAGIAVRGSSPARVLRFGFEYYDGRSTLGEFFQDAEQSIAIGIWIDL